MDLKIFQQLGGVSVILEALIYIFVFIVYGALLVYPNANVNAFEFSV